MSMRRGLAWMALSQGSYFVIQFGGSAILSRLLNRYEFGVFATALDATALLNVVQAFGLAGFVVREPELAETLVTSVFTVNAILAVALAALIAGLSPVIGAFLHAPSVRDVLLALSLLPLIGITEFLPAAQVERAGGFRLIALITLVRVLVTNGVTLSFAAAGFSSMSIAYGTLAGAAISAAGYNLVGRQHVRWRLGLSEWRRVTRFGVQMLAIAGAGTIATRTAGLIMGRLLGLGAYGLYARASNLNNLLWDNIHLVIGRVVFVDLAARRREGASLRDSYLRIVETVTALLWPAFAGLAVVAGPFILVVYGREWVAAALPLALLCLAAMVLVAITMTWEIFVLCGETATQARFEFVRTGVSVGLFTLGCLVSLPMAAAARVAESVFSLLLYRPHLDRMTGTRWRDFTPIYGRSALLTAAAVGPSAALMTAFGWSEHTPLLPLSLTILMGGLAWLLLLWALRHPLYAEITRLLPARLRPPAR